MINILVLSPNKGLFDDLDKLVKNLPSKFSLSYDSQIPSKLKDIQWIVLDLSIDQSESLVKKPPEGLKGLIPISSLTHEEFFRLYFEPGLLDCCIGGNGVHTAREVIQLISWHEKWSDPSDIFSLLSKNHKIFKRRITDTSHINPVIKDGIRNLALPEYFSGFLDNVTLISNELITNGLYNAPFANGKPKYESMSRKQKIVMEEGEDILFRLGSDEDYTLISVRDNFGRLTRETICQRLQIGFDKQNFKEKKSGGAGAGIFMTIASSNIFMVNVLPKKQTDVICLIEHTKRYAVYRRRIPSFNYLVRT